MSDTLRLNQYLAKCGLGTRRQADGLIRGGRVMVNGEVVTEMGSRVSPLTDEVHCDGALLSMSARYYRLYNKPIGEEWRTQGGAPTQLWIDKAARFEVEVDAALSPLANAHGGLILLTNDPVMHKADQQDTITQLYSATTDESLNDEQCELLLNGGDGRATIIELDRSGSDEHGYTTGILMRGGTDRLLRSTLVSVGATVLRLDRKTYAGLTKLNLPRGHCRDLAPKEVGFLKMGK